MVRETSIEAYNTIKDNGLLSRLRFTVYDYVFSHGPCTMREAIQHLCASGLTHGSVSTRFSELENFGVIETVGKAVCGFSKNTVLLWDVTGRLPVKPPKEETKDQKITRLEKRVAELEALVKDLRGL